MKVKGIWYQTVGPPISEEAAYAIVGSATRVWKVREMLSDGSLGEHDRVLKDYWIFKDSSTEREIQAAIFAELSEADLEEAKRHFLTFIDEEVITHHDRLELLRAADSEGAQFTNPAREHRASGSSSRQASRDAAVTRPEPPAPVELEHVPRKNVRAIVQEVCLSVYELADFKSLCLCLLGVSIGMACISSSS